MYIAQRTNPVVEIRAEARRRAGRGSLLARLHQWLEQTWARRQEWQMEQAVLRLEHPDVLSEMRAARRRV
jgi:hypothetical protein